MNHHFVVSDTAENASDIASKSAFSQLLVAVGALCAQVRSLAADLDAYRNQSGGSGRAGGVREVRDGQPLNNAAPESMAGHGGGLNEAIREEVREVREQDKRRMNVILRGFGRTENEVKQKFKNVSRRLVNHECRLAEVIKVNGQANMFRVKMVDEEERTELLLNARQLKDMEGCQNLFIQRDLTFKQRQEAYRRRNQRREEEVAAGVGSADGDAGEDEAGRSEWGRGRGRGRGARTGAHGSAGSYAAAAQQGGAGGSNTHAPTF